MIRVTIDVDERALEAARRELGTVLDRLPDNRVEAALASLDAVKGKDTTIEGIFDQESCNAEAPE